MSKNKRFTGGDKLKGFEKKVHEVLMKTELNDGYGAYKISYAENKKGGNSGLSFGGNQMDLSQDDKDKSKKTIFLGIIENAKDSSGNSIVSGEEFINIKANPNLTTKGNKPEVVFGDLLPKINKALSSEYGVQKIDEAYGPELKSKIQHVHKAITSLSNKENAKAVLANEEMMARLVDYHNQFSLSLKDKKGELGPMLKFLNGEKVTLHNFVYDDKGKKVIHAGFNNDPLT